MTRNTQSRRNVLRNIGAGSAAIIGIGVFTGTGAADHDPDDGPVYDDGDTPSRDGDWNQLQNERVYIYYRDGYDDDAELMSSYVTDARAEIRAVIDSNDDSHVELYILPVDEYDRDEFEEYESRGGDEDPLFEYFRFSFYAASESPLYDDVSIEDRDRDYKRRVSEAYFRSILIRLVAIHRGTGDYREVMPRWFTAGFPSYIAEFETPFGSDRMSEYMDAYAVDIHASAGDGESVFEHVVDSDAEDVGARRLLLMQYLMSEFGFEAVLHAAVEESASFEAAVEAQFGVSMSELAAGFDEWIVGAYPIPDVGGGSGAEFEGEGEVPSEADAVDGGGDDDSWWYAVLGAGAATAAGSGAYLAREKWGAGDAGAGDAVDGDAVDGDGDVPGTNDGEGE